MKRTRDHLVEDPQGLVEVLEDPDFKSVFPKGLITRKTLNVVPEGYNNDDPAAPFLKMVDWGCQATISDDDLLDDEAIYTLIDIFRAAAPLVRHFD